MDTKTHYVKGFPSTAAFIASDPDKTTLIFRRFDRLAARNLLHLQAELARLETLIDERDNEDARAGLTELQHLRNWDDFKNATDSDSGRRERLELFDKLQQTMEAYRMAWNVLHKGTLTEPGKAMMFESQLASLSTPSNKVLTAFTKRLVMGDGEKFYPVLGGSCSNLLSDANDLVALKISEHSDRLTSFAQDHLAFLFQVGIITGMPFQQRL